MTGILRDNYDNQRYGVQAADGSWIACRTALRRCPSDHGQGRLAHRAA